jgi:membrane-bound metal-dependent hydrolase YbcI (DUF457 family)
VFVGGLFPDLDTHSTPSKWAAKIGVTVSATLIYLNHPLEAAIIGLGFMLTKCGKHRGWTHSLLLPVAVLGLSYHQNVLIYGLGFSIGLLIHTLADDIYTRLKRSKHF